jgi:hypothetical protein
MNPDPNHGFTSSSAYGPREERSNSIVLISGLITTALALLGVYALDRYTDDFHIMGWYANRVIPVGALLVGLVAASGYGIVSWLSGVKITRGLLWLIVALQVLAYFTARYIEFRSLKLPMSFFEFYDFAARSIAWKQDNGTLGEPVGAWGYGIRFLEVAGFVFGGLVVPLVMLKAPYCPACQLYMKTRQLTLFPASVTVRKVKKSNVAGQAAYEAEQQQAFDQGKQTLEALQQLAAKGDSAGFRKRLDELQPGQKAAGKLPGRFALKLVHCKRCCGGHLISQHILGQGNQIKTTELARADIHSEFVRSILQ